MKRKQIFSAALALTVFSGAAYGQGLGTQNYTQAQTNAQGTNTQGTEVQANARVQPSDVAMRSDHSAMNKQIAQWVLADQRNLVELAKYGAQRTKTPAVRELAQKVEQEHSRLIEQLTQVVNQPMSDDATNYNANQGQNRSVNQGVVDTTDNARQTQRDQRQANVEATRELNEAQRDANRDADGVRRPLENAADRIGDGVERAAEAIQNTAEAGRERIDELANRVQRNASVEGDNDSSWGSNGSNMQMSSQWVSIHQQIGDKVAQEARAGLEENQDKFDDAFVGMLAASHLHQEATLSVLSDKANGQLQQVLENAKQTVAQHRQQAEQVMRQIER